MEFPKHEAKTLLAWMREQMYGDKPTEWTNGNEHDHMLDCADPIQTLVDRTKTPYREYVLSKCKRHWEECQEEYGCGPWSSQSEAQQRAFFEEMYDELWPDRGKLDDVYLPDEPEDDAWKKLISL